MGQGQIHKNPNRKEAFFERASAYFELGDYQQAIEDYISSDFEKLSSDHKLVWNQIPRFGAGITKGIIQGAKEGLTEFIPETLSTLRGIGRGLWAFSADPVGASVAFCTSCNECIQFIKNHGQIEKMVPELKQLLIQYDKLSDFERGNLIGTVIGKYGIDILIFNYSFKSVKAFWELKAANRLLTLEALASPKNLGRELQSASKKFWSQRREFLKKANLSIHEGRQGKHIIKHKNYDPRKNRSIFEHPNPKQLIEEFAGTGIKDSLTAPGSPGYKEVINFGEHIGFAIDAETLNKIPTTWGKVHYSKDGVHIVPYVPKDLVK